MTIQSFLTSGIALLLLVTVGCQPDPIKPAPVNQAEYRQMGQADRSRWPENRVVQINLTRVHDNELSTDKRMDSLKLVEQIGAVDETDLADLATLLREPSTPTTLKNEILMFLLKQNYRDLASYATAVLQDPAADPQLKQAVMDYLGKNPAPQMLAGIVRRWAEDPDTSAQSQTSYEQAVQKISDQPWDKTLLEGLNTPGFPAKGYAIEILARRMDKPTLAQKLLALNPRTEEVKALQGFVETFDYIPPTNQTFITTTILWKVRNDMVPDAARLSIDWTRNYGYAFAIRDFHLLSRLARDPLRSNLKRTQLVLEVGQSLKTRKHAPRTAGGANADDHFWLQVDELTMADLWNLYLLNEMLSRPRVQTAMQLMAEGDLADTSSAWGGLVFYQNGQAEAILYPPDPQAAADDMVYHPSQRLLTDSRDALCRFIGHFEKITNADRVGPSEEELADAARMGYYGLVLTRMDEDTFAAHYFNPQGKVISLGRFPMKR